jgi:hypothetical protein
VAEKRRGFSATQGQIYRRGRGGLGAVAGAGLCPPWSVDGKLTSYFIVLEIMISASPSSLRLAGSRRVALAKAAAFLSKSRCFV